jgi:uncharacterized membrane protein
MIKRNKIIYWIATLFLTLGMTAGGVQQMLQIGGYNDIANRLGYPLYMLTILGVWKLLGVVAILVPKFPLLKEWAYAGFFFAMSGATISHFIVGEPFTEALPSLMLLLMTLVSWHFRPVNKTIGQLKQNTYDKSRSELVFQ